MYTSEGQVITRIIKLMNLALSDQYQANDPNYNQSLQETKLIITILKRHCKDKIYI